MLLLSEDKYFNLTFCIYLIPLRDGGGLVSHNNEKGDFCALMGMLKNPTKCLCGSLTVGPTSSVRWISVCRHINN